MTVFERITQSPEVLGEFLACLSVIEGPWDDRFHEQFCDGCAAENCDKCPNEAQRNNPGWWLTLEAGEHDDSEGACPLHYITPAERLRRLRQRGGHDKKE